MNTFIFCPHVDDEIIGCWSRFISMRASLTVFYVGQPEQNRMDEALQLAEVFKHHMETINPHEIGTVLSDYKPSSPHVYAPDFHWEHHPAHKAVGAAVYAACVRNGLRFFSYSTDMSVPYLRELSGPDQRKKKATLDATFPSQKSLWENDWKYHLFEGISEWHPPVA